MLLQRIGDLEDDTALRLRTKLTDPKDIEDFLNERARSREE